MSTALVGTAIGTAVTVPQTTQTVIAAVAPGILNPPTIPVLVVADCVLIGASSVTAITMEIRRGAAATGTLLATAAETVSGAVTRTGTVSFIDTAYDGKGYCLTMAATGAAGTCGPGALTAQPLDVSF